MQRVPEGIVRNNYDGEDEEMDEEEISVAERELAEDAQWKIIQKNTFTRWANEQLKQVNKTLVDLQSDLGDGLRLLALIEVLAGKQFKQFNRRPNFRTQKLENVTMALKFLEEEEGIRLVNIDSSDIVDGKLKLILGLVWTLILHYSISMPVWEGEEELPQGDTGKGPTPRQRLLAWINSKLPDCPISNFTTNWNDGRAIGALVDACGPGLCPDWDEWNPRNALENATEAMDNAEKWLDVPQLIKPDELINPQVDEKAVMTYLSQFPNAKLKPDAPLRPKTNPARVRAYGPGLEPVGNTVGAPARFVLETFSAGRGNVEIVVLNPRGQPEPCEVLTQPNQTYACAYVPKMEGEYRVVIKFANRELPKSPYRVAVEGAAGDPGKVTVSGPGIQRTGNQVGKRTYFEVFTQAAGTGIADCAVVDPRGNRDTVKPRITPQADGVYLVEYTPKEDGSHSVQVLFAGQPIPNSPFPVLVAAPSDPSRAHATGRGIQPKGVRVRDVADFVVHTANAGPGELQVQVQAPGGGEERCKVVPQSGQFLCSYVPQKAGPHTVNVQYAGGHIPRSPFRVDVGPPLDSRIRAFGPGLFGGTVNKPAAFTVQTNGEAVDSVGVDVEGPSESRIDCRDRQNGTVDVTYWPTQAGEYAVHVVANGEDIVNSPWMAQVAQPADSDNSDVDKVRAEGPGLAPTGVQPNANADFTVDTRSAQSGRSATQPAVSVACFDGQSGAPVDLQTTDNRDGTFWCRYVPRKAGLHVVFVTYGGANVPGSPFHVDVAEPARADRVRVFGPGVESAIRNQSTFFVCNTSQAGAGAGPLTVAVLDERKQPVPIQPVTDKEETTVSYTPKSIGTFTAQVNYAGQPAPGSPFSIAVHPDVDIGKVSVQGLEPSVFAESITEFIVDARGIEHTGDAKVKAIITPPSGARNVAAVESKRDGTYKCSYTPFEKGVQRIEVTYDGLLVPGSPFSVNVVGGCDPTRVRAYGPGLQGGFTNESQSFTVETKGAGQSTLGLAIEGPSEAKMTCRDNRDGTCTVEYLPTRAGTYEIGVKFGERDVPGSPFSVPIRDRVDPTKCRAYGSGLEPSGARAKKPAKFVVDASRAGQAPLDVTYADKLGNRRPADIRTHGDGLYDCIYYPESDGPHVIEVRHDGVHVPGSPFRVDVLPTVEPHRVVVTGDGVRPNGVLASLPTSFSIDARNAGEADLDIQIRDPEGRPVKSALSVNPDNTFSCTYTPEDVGQYAVAVNYGGQPVLNSPFLVRVAPTGAANKVLFVEPPRETVPVGEETVITLNTAEAGVGAVTCRIRQPNNADADLEIEDNGDGTVSVYYTPRIPGVQTIELKFGGQMIPQGQLQQKAVPADDLDVGNEEVVQRMHANRVQAAHSAGAFYPVDFRLPLPADQSAASDMRLLNAEVITPSGVHVAPTVNDNGDGTATIKYLPNERGMHELHVSYNGRAIPGSPFKFFVESLGTGRVTAYGPGLSHGRSGQPCEFTLVTKEAGPGGLSMAVEGPSKAEIKCVDNKDGTCSVSYLPLIPGEYQVCIKFMDKHISGSPFAARVVGEVRQRAQLSVGTGGSDISLRVTEQDIANLVATIRSPTGREEPCVLKRMPNGHLGISFTPREIGEHMVNVYRAGKHIANSPFRIYVGEAEIGNAKNVKVYGPGLQTGMARQPNEFYVDTKDAGYGGLGLSIEGPSKADIDCRDLEDGRCLVSYTPMEPGTYIVNVKYADQHVPGSPFVVHIGGEPSQSRVTQMLTRQREAADVTQIGSTCELSLKLPSTSLADMDAHVTAPSGAVSRCELTQVDPSRYSVRFVPHEMGVHTVDVTNRKRHIPGSPFQFTVGPITAGGAGKVRAVGPGLESASVAAPAEFMVYTREAGAGGLSIAIEGPSKAEIDFEDRRDGSCAVAYRVSEPGEYAISIKFNEEHIPSSPFTVFAAPDATSASRLSSVLAFDQTVLIGRPLAFTVNYSMPNAKLRSVVESPSGAEDEAIVQEIDRGQYAVRFIPKEGGPHLIHVLLDDRHIPGSPFRILVGKYDADPGMVHAVGDGLTHGVVSQKCKFLVNTVNAGSGALSVTVEGPSKVQLNCSETDDGYEFTYLPTVAGDYNITIKYGGNFHIVGSPFRAHIVGGGVPVANVFEESHLIVDATQKNGAPASTSRLLVTSDLNIDRVSCRGLGLKRAVAGRPSQFSVDAAGAGNAMLTIGILGPTGIPCDELNVKHTGRQQYTVTYTLRDKGQYTMAIKWGDQHVANSPFVIDVV